MCFLCLSCAFVLTEFHSNYVPLNGTVINTVERVDNQLFAYTTDGHKYVSKILEIEEAYNMVKFKILARQLTFFYITEQQKLWNHFNWQAFDWKRNCMS